MVSCRQYTCGKQASCRQYTFGKGEEDKQAPIMQAMHMWEGEDKQASCMQYYGAMG